MQSKAITVDQYIDELPEERKKAVVLFRLAGIQKAIKNTRGITKHLSVFIQSMI